MRLNHFPHSARTLPKARYGLLALVLMLFVGNSSRSVVLAQPAQSPETPRLVVKIIADGPRGFSFPVRDRITERDGAILGRLAKNDSAPAIGVETEPPRQVFLKFTAVHEGDAVRVRVVTLPVSPRHEDFVPGKDEKEIFNKLVAEDAAFTVQEVTALGLEPLQLKIEPYTPRPEQPLPQVVNELPALEVVAWEPVKRGPIVRHRLKLRNLSDKNIVALQLAIRYSDKSGSGEGYADMPLIAAGGFYEIETTLGSESPNLPPRTKEGETKKVLIKAILFDDWTYQGDTETAIELSGTRMGENVQKLRAVAILNKVLNSPSQADDAVLAELAQQFTALSVEPDAFLIDELAARFPDFKQSNARDLFTNGLRSGLHGVRQVFLDYQLTDIKRERKQNPQQFNLRESLLKLKTELGQLNQ